MLYIHPYVHLPRVLSYHLLYAGAACRVEGEGGARRGVAFFLAFFYNFLKTRRTSLDDLEARRGVAL